MCDVPQGWRRRSACGSRGTVNAALWRLAITGGRGERVAAGWLIRRSGTRDSRDRGDPQRPGEHGTTRFPAERYADGVIEAGSPVARGVQRGDSTQGFMVSCAGVVPGDTEKLSRMAGGSPAVVNAR